MQRHCLKSEHKILEMYIFNISKPQVLKQYTYIQYYYGISVKVLRTAGQLQGTFNNIVNVKQNLAHAFMPLSEKTVACARIFWF